MADDEGTLRNGEHGEGDNYEHEEVESGEKPEELAATGGGENGEDYEEEEDDDESDRPVVELFVKAAVDKLKNGSCPICHRYFMIFYVLRERGLIDLVVTTFLPENPPKEVLAFSNGKRYPLVKVHKGVDAQGRDMTGMECDIPDEIERLIDRFDCDDMRPRRRGDKADEAERAFENLYPKFKIWIKGGNDKLKDPEPVLRILGRINFFLKSSGEKFLISDTISRPDCYLLPILQHVRVAGKAYRDFEIPTELSYLWTYLGNAYDTDAFKESCPADREIITHYINLVQSHSVQRMITRMGDSRTFSVPEINANEEAE